MRDHIKRPPITVRLLAGRRASLACLGLCILIIQRCNLDWLITVFAFAGEPIQIIPLWIGAVTVDKFDAYIYIIKHIPKPSIYARSKSNINYHNKW